MRTWTELIYDLQSIVNEMDKKLTEEIYKNSRRKGTWIDIVGTGWQCSNCQTLYAERLTHKAHNYCTVCGADMRGEE